MTTPNDLPSLPDQPIFEEFSAWAIEPVVPVGWSATQTTGSSHVHIVAAPTLIELRQKLREVTTRKPLPERGQHPYADGIHASGAGGTWRTAH